MNFSFPQKMGLNGFHWFFGVIEDVNDPEMLGRVKVRILGLHSEELVPNNATGKGIPTDDLPWSYVLKSTGSSSVDGLGWSGLGYVQGSWVFGFARDGGLYQDLVIMGSHGGIPEKGPEGTGFNDPDGVYPEILNEPDINRLARGVTTDTIVKNRSDNLVSGISMVSGSWSEVASPFSPEYPFNEVFESRAGHVFEIDDTPGAERLSRYHTTGTYEEIGPDGERMVKVVGDDFEIVIGKKKVYAKGQIDITAGDGININVNGDVKVKASGDIDAEASGDIKADAKSIDAKADTKIDAKVGASKIAMSTASIKASNAGSSVTISPVGVALVGPKCTVNGTRIKV